VEYSEWFSKLDYPGKIRSIGSYSHTRWRGRAGAKRPHGFAEVAAGENLALLGHFLQFSSRFELPASFRKRPHERSRGFHEGNELVSKTHVGLVVAGCDFVKSFPKNGIASQVESCWSHVRYGKRERTSFTQGIEINGSIRFTNDMIIDGKIEGEITSEKGKVTIAENATIKGDVKAGEVKLYGKVEGTIKSDRCELKGKSHLKGDITTKTLSMEEGATLAGSTHIG
jgi:cytoskeletal protein CcmA (bactofilin family)